MEILSSALHLAVLTAMSLLSVLPHEVTVRSSDLQPCEGEKKVCVTNPRDCDPRPPSSVQRSLNVSCYYRISRRSVTCEWSRDSDGHDASEASLIFSSDRNILSCEGLINPAATIHITARIRSYGAEIWSQRRLVSLGDAVRPSPPALTVVGSTQHSVAVSWSSSRDYAQCRLRYRVNNSQTWCQAQESFLVTLEDEELVYTIEGLRPYHVYTAAAACRDTIGTWSRWSSGVTALTLESETPSASPQVCYRLEDTDSAGRLLLRLMWKALDPRDSGGRILGYQVTGSRYGSVTEPPPPQQDRFIQNVTEEVAVVVVQEGKWSVSVRAIGALGYGPAAHLSIDTQTRAPLPSVRSMWVSTSFPAVKGFVVQWAMASDPPRSALPVEQFDVQWRPETFPSTSRWSTVDGSTTSALIRDVEADESYQISVSPVYKQQCGAPQSLAASLQHGALMEVDQLKVSAVSKTTVTAVWAWQRRAAPVRVNIYRVMLWSSSEKHTQSLWPDQRQHTFLNLTPSTEYTLVLLADDVTRIIIPVATEFNEVPVVAAATPLLLLAVTVAIVSVLSRTVYKRCLFPTVSTPRNSSTGQWLMDPNRKIYSQKNILDIKNLQETDFIGVKSAIVVGTRWSDLHEDAALLPLGHFSINLSDVKLDTECASGAPLAAGRHLPDGSGEAALLHRPTFTPDSCFLQQEEQRRLDCWTPQQRFDKLMADAGERCSSQITCEPEYVVNCSYQRKNDVETESKTTRCSLICDSDYIPNAARTPAPLPAASVEC